MGEMVIGDIDLSHLEELDAIAKNVEVGDIEILR